MRMCITTADWINVKLCWMKFVCEFIAACEHDHYNVKFNLPCDGVIFTVTVVIMIIP